MISVYSRDDFVSFWRNFVDVTDQSPLWIPEVASETESNWFVSVNPIKVNWSDEKEQYYKWCHENMAGTLLCYSSGDGAEWWGFTNKDDILWWLLKWSS